MSSSRHDEYRITENTPFIIYKNLRRSKLLPSETSNWHSDPEIQFCISGEGYVVIDGKYHTLNEGQTALINSDAIHYTGTDSEITYSVLIISKEFCLKSGIDLENFSFKPIIKSDKITSLFTKLLQMEKDRFKTPKEHIILLEIMVEIAEHFSEEYIDFKRGKSFETVKNAINFIRKNYNEKISLESIARSVYTDKYTLSREFKKFTAQTVTQYINLYRCRKAYSMITAGATVTEAAEKCGFFNLSFFTKTFKKYTGILPSECKSDCLTKIQNSFS